MPTGLYGAEQALDQAGMAALNNLGLGTDAALELLGGAGANGMNMLAGKTAAANDALNPFVNTGIQANDAMAAMLGLGGNFDFAQMMDSPAVKFRQEQGLQALERAASASGNLGSGSFGMDMLTFNQDFASQELDKMFERLGFVSGQGQQSASQQSGNLMSEAGMGTNLINNFGTVGANIRANEGQVGANLARDFGFNRAAGRTRAGENIAGQIANTSSALAGVQERTGSNLSSVIDSSSSEMAAMIDNLANRLGVSQQQLAAMLGNIVTGQGTTIAGLPTVGGVQNNPGTLGQWGNLASGLGNAFTAWNNRN